MNTPLVTEFGRVSRQGVTERAQEIFYSSGTQMTWGEARGQAYREAAVQLRARFNPARSPVAIPMRERAYA